MLAVKVALKDVVGGNFGGVHLRLNLPQCFRQKAIAIRQKEGGGSRGDENQTFGTIVLSCVSKLQHRHRLPETQLSERCD